MATTQNARRPRGAQESFFTRLTARRSGLFLSVMIFVVTWLLIGGGVPDGALVFYLFALSGSWLLGYVLVDGGMEQWRDLPPSARLAVAFFCLMPLLQCLPLPPEIWHALPNRDLAVRTLSFAGVAGEWHPITLTFEATFRSFLMSVWLLGLLLAVLRFSTAELTSLFRLLLAMGLLHVAVGMLQVASGGRFLFHDVPNINFLLGFFANKNHSGLFIALMFLFGYIALYGVQGWNRARLPLVAAASLVLFATLILTFSRAGLFFGVLALAFLVLLSFEKRLGRASLYAIMAIFVAAAILAVLGSTDIAARSLNRFTSVGSDPRWLFWSWSRQLVPLYFPVGSGIGSFPEVFKVLEQLGWVKPTYLNHAHNEYLEQLIEVGIAAPILWLLVVVMLARPVASAWRDRARPSGRMALIGAATIFLVLLHSAFDYPLRRPGLAAVFVVALGTLLRRRSDRKSIA